MTTSVNARRTLLAATIALVCATASAQGPAAAITAAAQKEGWWIRVNPTNQAARVYWRVGSAANQLGGPVTWVQGESPESVDLPAPQRTLEHVFMAALGMPPAAPVSFCLFFRDRGVSLVEFTQEKSVELDRSLEAAECVP
jgi:hypothetical protein